MNPFFLISGVVLSTQVLGMPTTLGAGEHNTNMEQHRATNDGKRLYQGMHLPPGFRNKYRFHRRQIPYGGFFSFGNAPVVLPSFQQPPPGKKDASNGKGSRGSLLGIVDVDVGLHLK
ncbi:hypothetical protein H4R20_001008 [Coemansia guatemalensis]|uniref:Secreted protein n=1 Tax=Coemansia guatemalensis TaxID=2761395 RepID=A0A9W8LWE0_9FUNG|nr:hypothetical protein H4R20_001008 [Coemansia guatemalensis]